MTASTFRFFSSLSILESREAAVAEITAGAAEGLGGPPDLAMLFPSADWAPQAEEIAAAVCQRLGSETLLGCTAESLIGVGREVEGQTGLALWAARLPGASVLPMHLTFERAPEGGAIVGWPDELEQAWPENSTLLLLGEPFSFPADALLERLNEDQPGVQVIGGMASGGASPGDNRLLYGRQAAAEGAVAALISGVRVQTVVSQGCRPIGSPYVVTKAERNIIYELGGKPALMQLKQLFDQLPTREQQMVQRGLHLGSVVSEYQEHFATGDFLVRNVIGIDPNNGSIAVGDYIRRGQTVQFHLRDDQTAHEDLKQLLAQAGQQTPPAAGALMFSCNGRGTRLFSQPHHDAATLAAALGQIPLAGFFAAGEIGPVAGKNFMHGFTASIALFESR